MIWIRVEDSWYYENLEHIKEEAKKRLKNKALEEKINDSILNKDKVAFVFEKETVTVLLKKGEFEKIIISPYFPTHFGLNTSFFGVVDIKNRYGILTTSEKLAGVTEYKKLNALLGLTVEKSDFTFKDLGENKKLTEVAQKLDAKYAFGEIPKAVFLAGIMGTGKTFFAQCLAGETNRLLVSFNLAKLMNFQNPIEAFDNVIEYLLNEKGRYLLWIDEIEKMFNGSEKSEHIKNKFLTFLNDLGLTIKLDAFVVITANDVTGILDKNPEMMRSGRVEPFAKIFMDFLTIESATKIMDLYLKKRNDKISRINYICSTVLAYYENRLPKIIFFYEIIDQKAKRITEILKNQIEDLDEKEKINFIRKNLLNIFSENEIKNIMERLYIPLEANYIVDFIDRIYRIKHKDTELVNFPYVPAEIKEIVAQLFFKQAIEPITDKTKETVIEEIVESNIAIGDAGKAGVNRMLGNKERFSIIIN